MYVNDGIAYAGEQTKPIKIISVRPLDDYKLWLRFSTGETKIFDGTNLLDYPAFFRLKDKQIFNSVYLDYGIPTWYDGEIDICPHMLYEQSILAEDYFRAKLIHL